MDGYLDADQTADLLGIKRRSLYHYVRRLEDFPQPTRIGRTLLFEKDEIKAWRAAHPSRRVQARSGLDGPHAPGSPPA
ncbi:helix-turn-helix transcriptional regulator [Streptosporangium canum]|uniref:helix-turn-helix transcriptional regulator n=1 Tax=Streptosporangium canum TaxID=324952 RepID=UPI0036D00ABA